MSYLGPEKSGNLHEHAKYTLEKGRMDYQNELENNRYQKAGSWWTVFISLGVIALFFALVFLLG
jgi:hypothetical protein